MQIVAERLKLLRTSVGLSQKKIAEMMGIRQASINRYETEKAIPSAKYMIWYADYFDVSLDYIYGRTDKPQGKLYDYNPAALKDKITGQEQIKEFLEFLFEPGTTGNEKLKASLAELLGGKK
jgi:transcriptional regulator with XRE-family HTH domain